MSSSRRRLVLVVGARPNFIKALPILDALASYPVIDVTLGVLVGQCEELRAGPAPGRSIRAVMVSSLGSGGVLDGACDDGIFAIADGAFQPGGAGRRPSQISLLFRGDDTLADRGQGVPGADAPATTNTASASRTLRIRGCPLPSSDPPAGRHRNNGG